MLLQQKIVKCEHCQKEFLFYGEPKLDDKLFCSPECGEEFEVKQLDDIRDAE